jgi:hypothetical protein
MIYEFSGCVSKPEQRPFSDPLLPTQIHPSTPLRNPDSGIGPTRPAPVEAHQTVLYIVATHAANLNPKIVNFVP